MESRYKFRVVDNRGDEPVVESVTSIDWLNKIVCYTNEYNEEECVPFDECTLLQYTGKKDNHETEICQGDICKNGDWEPDANAYNYRIEEVVWDDGNAMWLGWNPNENGMCCEIIGTVHENPELLEEKSHA